ncbi:MAG: PilZ domain-containing protein [Acidobacteriota bacterium]
MEERRRFHRWDCSVPCRFSIAGHTFEGCVVNLSFNGAQVEAQGASPAVDARFVATLNPGSEDVQIPARVIYSTDEAYGLLFEASREELVRKLMPFFRSQIDSQDLELGLDQAAS